MWASIGIFFAISVFAVIRLVVFAFHAQWCTVGFVATENHFPVLSAACDPKIQPSCELSARLGKFHLLAQAGSSWLLADRPVHKKSSACLGFGLAEPSLNPINCAVRRLVRPLAKSHRCSIAPLPSLVKAFMMPAQRVHIGFVVIGAKLQREIAMAVFSPEHVIGKAHHRL